MYPNNEALPIALSMVEQKAAMPGSTAERPEALLAANCRALAAVRAQRYGLCAFPQGAAGRSCDMR